MLASYAYLGDGTVVKTDYDEPGLSLDYFGGATGTYTGFDRFGRVVDHRWDDLNSIDDADRFKYGYDRNSNRTYRENTLTSGHDELYAYDKLNRLTQAGRGTLNGTKDGFGPADETFRQAWGLDGLGNWDTFKEYSGLSLTLDLDQSRTHNAVNEIDTDDDHGNAAGASITASTGTNWFDPTYDAAGNMTALPKPDDPANGYTAIYDAWNRLVEVKDGTNIVVKYEYDGVGRRIIKKEYDTPGTWSRDRHYYYTIKWQIIEERVDSSTLADRQYVWGQGYVDDMILRDRDSTVGGDLGNTGSGLDERLYSLRDANYNIISITDTNGDAVERYSYTPYGDRTIMDALYSVRMASSYDWQFGHQCLMHDEETGLINNRARLLHFGLGRWIQREPLGYVDGMSLYQYVKCAPTFYVDPTGYRAATAEEMGLGSDCSNSHSKNKRKWSDDPDKTQEDWHARNGAYFEYTATCTEPDRTITGGGYRLNVADIKDELNDIKEDPCCSLTDVMISTHHVPGVGSYANPNYPAVADDDLADAIELANGAQVDLNLCDSRGLAEKYKIVIQILFTKLNILMGRTIIIHLSIGTFQVS